MLKRNPWPWLGLILGMLIGTGVFAYTPDELFQDGRRQFLLGHWLEARDQLDEFLDKWPGHALANEALSMRTLANIRGDEREKRLAREHQLASLTTTLEQLTKALPDQDFVEVQCAIAQLRSELGEDPASTSFPLSLTSDFLRHAMARNWFPGSFSPIQTLGWIRDWKTRQRRIPNDVNAGLELIRAKALWVFYLSPLPTGAFIRTLEMWGEWPIERALRRSLKEAFEKGDHQIKREAALLGMSVSQVGKTGRKSQETSEYYHYLLGRGIFNTEAWCPR